MTTEPTALRTPLYALHLENGAKMVPFAGYEMPINYPLGIMKEHLHTRAKAGLFDVSHMGQVRVTGDQVATELEGLIPIDIEGLAPNQQRYGFFTNAKGGIEDDLMVTNWGDHYLVVVNAACKTADIAHLNAHLPTSEVRPLDEHALLALQGPRAHAVMARLDVPLNDLAFMHTRRITIAGVDCALSRSGYTGEDGFELSVTAEHAEPLARALQADEDVEWIGLGARDTLRLEGGLCLYGHDIDTTTTPVEASLSWAISPARRLGGAREGGFPGDDFILPKIGKKPARKRVGLAPEGRAPIRESAELINAQGEKTGVVTSGGFSPSLKKPIAMGYVSAPDSKVGSTVFTEIRGQRLALRVTSPTFVPNNFYRI